MGPVLQVRGLSLEYSPTGRLDEVELDVDRDEAVALVGAPAEALSALLACISGVYLPETGQIRVGSALLTGMPSAARERARRRRVGLFSGSMNLLPRLSVGENVGVGMLSEGIRRARALRIAGEALEQVGMAGYADTRVADLSLGEARRVLLARALVWPTLELLICDQPTQGLDAANTMLIGEVLVAQAHERGVATLVASADDSVVGACDRKVWVAGTLRAGD